MFSLFVSFFFFFVIFFIFFYFLFFFFSSRRRHTRSLCDWSFRRVLFRSEAVRPDHSHAVGVGQLDRLALQSRARDRKSTRLNSSHTVISYAVFCLKKK